MDRATQRLNWLKQALGTQDVRIERASEDASFRSYWREHWVLMDAPPDKEDCRPWLSVQSRLEQAGLHVPHVQAQDVEQGFLLLEDLGNTQYLRVLGDDSVDALYGDAIDALERMQQVDAGDLPAYDEALLTRELELFPEWFVRTHLGYSIDCHEWDVLEDGFRTLINSALEQPRRFVHRDYHSRNLMQVDGRNPGIIDFQDAVLGPVTYDLVSLLRDCYIAWPGATVEKFSLDFRSRLIQAGVLENGERRWHRWFDFMGVQRHLKAIGIFARLSHRDGKHGFLGDIPRTLGYVLEVCRNYAQLAEFGRCIDRMSAGLAQQPDRDAACAR